MRNKQARRIRKYVETHLAASLGAEGDEVRKAYQKTKKQYTRLGKEQKTILNRSMDILMTLPNEKEAS